MNFQDNNPPPPRKIGIDRIADFILPHSIKGILFLAIILYILFHSVAILSFIHRKFINPPIITQNLISGYIEKSKDLISTKYHYKNAAEYEGEHGLIRKSKKIIVLYEGKVFIGTDLSKTEIKVDNALKKIEIKLPKSKIIAHELNTSKIKHFDIDDDKWFPIEVDYREFNQQFWTKNKKEIELEILRSPII